MGALTSLVPPRSRRPPEQATTTSQSGQASPLAQMTEASAFPAASSPSRSCHDRPRQDARLAKPPGARAFAADGIDSPAVAQLAQTDRCLTRLREPHAARAPSDHSTPLSGIATCPGRRQLASARARRPHAFSAAPSGPSHSRPGGRWDLALRDRSRVGRRSSQWAVASGQLIEVAPHPPGVAVGRAAHGRGGLCLDGPAKVVIQSVERDLRDGSCDALDDCG